MERQLLPRPELSPTSPRPTLPATEQSPTTPKRRKENVTAVACAECKRKKAKCDGGKPSCRRCIERSVECVYNAVSASQRMTVLREQVREYAAENKQLRSENAFLASGPSDGVASTQEAQAGSELSLHALQQRWNDLPMGFMPMDANSGIGMNVFDDRHWGNDFVESHRIMPFHLFDEQSTSVGCTRFYQDSRRLLAQGAPPNEVLGGHMLNVNGLFPSGSSHTSHRLSSWAVDFARSFPEEAWPLRVATAYFVFHVMRWFIHPTAESFAAIPDFAKPTLLQQWHPHPFWIDFVVLPGSRDAFIKFQEVFSYQNWIHHHTRTQILWNGDFASAVHIHPVTGDLQITTAFETTIRASSNWVVPELFSNIDLTGRSETASSPSDSTSKMEWRFVS